MRTAMRVTTEQHTAKGRTTNISVVVVVIVCVRAASDGFRRYVAILPKVDFLDITVASCLVAD